MAENPIVNPPSGVLNITPSTKGTMSTNIKTGASQKPSQATSYQGLGQSASQRPGRLMPPPSNSPSSKPQPKPVKSQGFPGSPANGRQVNRKPSR